MHLSRSKYSIAISWSQLFFNCLNFHVSKEEEGNEVEASMMDSCTGWLFGTDTGSNAEAAPSNFDEPLCGTGELADGRQALV